MQPGSLMQIRKGVYGQGEVGIVVGPSRSPMEPCWDVLFHDGVRHIHPLNLQKPDGRLKPRKFW